MGETTASQSQTPPTTGRSRNVNIALWVGQVLLALEFLAAGSAKYAGTDAMVEMFDDIGAGQWLRFVTGTLELAGAVGLLIPLLSGLAALCLAGLMLAATIFTIAFLDDPFIVPILVGIVAGLVAWGRWPTTKALIARYRSPRQPSGR